MPPLRSSSRPTFAARREAHGGGTRFEEEMEFMPFEDEEGTELEMLPANVG